MTDRSPDSAVEPAPERSRLRFELIVASLLLAFGLFILPALIFWVGISMLGPYGNEGTAGLGTFYGDFFGDLATGSIRAWSLVVGPLVIISLVRLFFLRRPGEQDSSNDADRPASPPRQKPQPSSQHNRRVEPRVSHD
jgi:hypothetical protein